ncbi:MAG: OFA family MFS transporter, partial [Chloroflexota bacterium]
MTVLGGRLQDRYGPRLVVTLGGILAGLGMVLSSLTTSPWVFALSFGLLLGTGIGFVYATGTPTAVKWFPASKTGLIAGIVLAGFGLGSAWVAPLAKSLIASFGVQTTILWLGLGMLVVVVGLAQLLSNPPAGYQPAGSAPLKKATVASKVDFKPNEVVKTWQFFVLWLTFAFSAGAGLMIIGNLASIAGDQAGQLEFSALAVTVLAFGSGSGRVLAGALSDKFGRRAVLLASYIFQAIVIFLLSQAVEGSWLASIPVLALFSILIGVNYGAVMAVYPAITKDFYGLKNFGVNYGLVYTAWGLGGFMLSQIAGGINDATNTYTYAYFLSAGLLIVSAVMMYLIKPPQAALNPGEGMPVEPALKRPASTD